MKTFVIVSLAGVCTAFTGCTTINTVERAEPIAARQMVSDQRVLTDNSLNRSVRILGVNESTGPGDHLKVQIELQNTTRTTKGFSYKFEWFDANGMLLRTPASAFVPRQIEGKESIFITAVSPIATAKDFRLKLIESR
ncbi:MAG: YcfL family protein [Verrucomicrobia bacterium]|nr:YcfL family protein [Verrucomicrobiota bacterium]